MKPGGRTVVGKLFRVETQSRRQGPGGRGADLVGKVLKAGKPTGQKAWGETAPSEQTWVGCPGSVRTLVVDARGITSHLGEALGVV